ncbi:hypothetical protein LY90DRAFT_707770 [Neocallimastix californiae]|jgi:hypothetical protein|uniref:Uncharacterized protein n=1 Tax=Neocallimastix californiae TaxID=1754190 RepID=A0A1Y2AFA5_9FUNG|nr:hypothetical protein LY90DRAFT_707770 [Neocallimastix californiae]|eukprot:ORY20645.1 hypothetical protein LY90DRAFT_707770 [Neocallimastix californiae]
MKFTTPFIVLLAATSAYSFSLEKRGKENDLAQLQKIEDAFKQSNISSGDKEKIDQIMNIGNSGIFTDSSNDSSLGKSSDSSKQTSNKTSGSNIETDEGTAFDPKCEALIQKYYGCLPSKMEKSNYDQSCDYFNSDECAKIVYTKLTDHVKCKKAKEVENVLNKTLSIFYFSCTKDGNSYCPISKLNKEEKELTKDTLNDTCKKTVCREKAISSFTSTIEFQQDTTSIINSFSRSAKSKRGEINSIDEALAILNSKECEAQASSAHAIKMGSFLLLTATLFLYFF